MYLREIGFSHFQHHYERLPSDRVPARVAAVHRSGYELMGHQGRFFATASGALRRVGPAPVVGDWVAVAGAVIEQVVDRRTALSRRSASATSEPQVLVANVDVVWIVTAPQDFSARRIERYLAMIYEGGARPMLVFNKADQGSCPAPSLAEPVPSFAVSARTGAGVESLVGALCPGETVVLLGSSGVGKSALVNRIADEEIGATGPVRASDQRGRHTTTRRDLQRIGDWVLIDTPGLRKVGLVYAAEGLGTVFSDIEAISAECRYRDCRHAGEPGCAVALAVARGDLESERTESYARLVREEESARRRSDRRLQAQAGKRMGKMIKEAKAWRRTRRGR